MSYALAILGGAAALLLVQQVNRFETRIGLPRFTLVCIALAIAGAVLHR